MWTLGIENNFYKSTEWKKFVDVLKLKRANPQDGIVYCEHCGKPILKKYDLIAHHKIELTEENVNDTSISLNEDNIMLVCFNSHNQIHERVGYARKQVYIVYGAPFSGKMDYVKSVAGKDDIICDIDSIYEMISVNDRYNKSNCIKSNVFSIRDFIIDMIKVRSGKWKNAYIIATLASKNQRERLVNQVNGRLIFIDSTEAECIQRCRETTNNTDYINFITEWFEDYQE